ncbi:MAG: hypothetical protein BWX98_02596 [Candidatus Aminicenantes bacterium ADurb.Bin147]|nr:MAG: hypothetical protein BWX98_02596 [Candidatus Aminicenantes bacterium ADurb.Bin147]
MTLVPVSRWPNVYFGSRRNVVWEKPNHHSPTERKASLAGSFGSVIPKKAGCITTIRLTIRRTTPPRYPEMYPRALTLSCSAGEAMIGKKEL